MVAGSEVHLRGARRPRVLLVRPRWDLVTSPDECRQEARRWAFPHPRELSADVSRDVAATWAAAWRARAAGWEAAYALRTMFAVRAVDADARGDRPALESAWAAARESHARFEAMRRGDAPSLLSLLGGCPGSGGTGTDSPPTPADAPPVNSSGSLVKSHDTPGTQAARPVSEAPLKDGARQKSTTTDPNPLVASEARTVPDGRTDTPPGDAPDCVGSPASARRPSRDWLSELEERDRD